MVNMSQVMISPDFISKIHILSLTALKSNETCCNYDQTQLLSFWTLNPGTPLSTPLGIHISSVHKYVIYVQDNTKVCILCE